MRAHIINNGVIANTIEVDSLDAIPGLIDADIGGGIGDSLIDGVIVPKPADPVPVPASVTMRQARLALLGAGKLADVNTAIASLPEPTKSAATIEWEYSGEVFRNKALVQTLGPMLGLTDAQLDSLFIAAATL